MKQTYDLHQEGLSLSPQAAARRQVNPSNSYSRIIYFLFFGFAAYLVFPIVDVPLLGLSLSAPVFFLIAVACILKPPRAWFRAYRGWIILAGWLWTGIFISAAANGLLSGGTDLDAWGILTVIRYIYWLTVFVVTAYFASQGSILKKVSGVLGWSVFALALLRWGEVLLYGNIGAWTGTHLMSQNSYGFLFSIFSPFLLFLTFQPGRFQRLLAWVGNLALWGAVAVNGSRGSWVAVAAGLALCLLLLVISRPSKFLGLFWLILVVAGLAGAAWTEFPQVSTAVSTRFDTFQDLETDKSYLIRQLMIQKGWRLFTENPIIGVGASRFTQSSTPLDIPRELSYASQDHFDVKSSHNSYLGFLAESGIMGALPFAVLLVTLALGGLRSALHFTRRGQAWALMVFLSFFQMSIHMGAISSLTNTANWFVYGLAAASVVLYRRRNR